jgi:hypothetical protein
MSVEAAAGHLAALARLGVAAEGVHIGGGEPFGDFERLLAIVRSAQGAGLAGIGYVETNGFWAESADLVRRRLAALAGAGMIQLSISADPYHQEFVPAERARLLYNVAREVLGPRGVRVRRWKWLRHAQDVAAMAEDARIALFRSSLSSYAERMNGRAAECLAHLLTRRAIENLPQQSCRSAILESRHVHIDPQGWVSPGTCAGIILGQATASAPLDATLADWRLDGRPAIAALVSGGPGQLLPSAAARGFEVDAHGYAGKCHLCWAIRTHLVGIGAGPSEFGPRTLYQDP